VRKILEACPSCGSDLEITQVSCSSCETVVSARYAPCRFCRLSPESLRLVELFLKSRGNVKEMERELGLSYPTVRTRLDTALKELGFEEVSQNAEDERKTQRNQVLQRLENGELSAAAAAELLAQLK
jgi:hypothetical protein